MLLPQTAAGLAGRGFAWLGLPRLGVTYVSPHPGLPILNILRTDLINTGDEIKSIEGIFSGTLPSYHP